MSTTRRTLLLILVTHQGLLASAYAAYKGRRWMIEIEGEEYGVSEIRASEGTYTQILLGPAEFKVDMPILDLLTFIVIAITLIP